MSADVEEFENGLALERVGESSYVYDIGANDMPVLLAVALAERAPNYRLEKSDLLSRECWFNVCEWCYAPQEAFYLHSEIDGAFFGSPDDLEPGCLEELMSSGVTIPNAAYSR